MRVYRDPMTVGVDADGLETDVGDPGAPAGGYQQAVTAHLPAVDELQDVVLAVASGGGCVRADDELDAVAAQDLAERLAQRHVLAREHVPGALEQHHLAAKAAHGLRHLDADRAAAQDEQAAWDGLHGRRLAVGPDASKVAQAWDRRNDRLRTAGHDDVLGGVAHAVDLDPAGSGEPAAAAQQLDAL